MIVMTRFLNILGACTQNEQIIYCCLILTPLCQSHSLEIIINTHDIRSMLWLSAGAIYTFISWIRSSGMWCCAGWYTGTDFLEQPAASIFKVQNFYKTIRCHNHKEHNLDSTLQLQTSHNYLWSQNKFHSLYSLSNIKKTLLLLLQKHLNLEYSFKWLYTL
jgi:hypothetical protein